MQDLMQAAEGGYDHLLGHNDRKATEEEDELEEDEEKVGGGLVGKGHAEGHAEAAGKRNAMWKVDMFRPWDPLNLGLVSRADFKKAMEGMRDLVSD